MITRIQNSPEFKSKLQPLVHIIPLLPHHFSSQFKHIINNKKKHDYSDHKKTKVYQKTKSLQRTVTKKRPQRRKIPTETKKQTK